MNKKYWLQGGERPGTWGSALSNSFSSQGKAINGTGAIAKDLVRVLERLTVQNDLRFLTMLPWSGALTGRHLLRPARAWCPTCYEEWRANDQIVYEPLLWTLQDVELCLRHRHRLRTQCQHCERSLPWLARSAEPGSCSKCGQWLGVDVDHFKDVIPADDLVVWQCWVSKNLEELMGSATYLPAPPKERIAKAISLCIDQVSEGTMNRFACLIGKKKNTVWGWQHGRAKIPMDDLLRICFQAGISVLDFLHTEFVAEKGGQGTNPVMLPLPSTKPTRRRPRPFDRETVRRLLEKVLKEEPSSMKEVAVRLKIEKRFLYKHFSSLCRAISARYAKQRKTHRELAKTQRAKDFNQVATRLHANGIYPSRRRVAPLVTRAVRLRTQSDPNISNLRCGDSVPVTTPCHESAGSRKF